MGNTYTQLYVHMIFWNLDYLFDDLFFNEVYAYINGVVKAKGNKPLAIGGIYNHIHVLVGLNPSKAVSDLVKDIKTNSTRFIRQKKFAKQNFRWQEGFGAFSYSRSQLTHVIKYINNQQEHHRRKTFREEYIEFLEKFGVDYDPKFIL